MSAAFPAPAATEALPLVEIASLSAGYDRRREVIRNIDLTIRPGEVIGIVGHNGAGKTTLLRALLGLIPARGAVRWEGRDISNTPVARRLAAGLAFVPAEQFTFAELSVRHNLQIARERSTAVADDRLLETARELFPVVWGRLDQRAGTMSGGEQRMLSLCMAFLRQPRLLLLDELSLGLAPALTERVVDVLRALREQHGMTILCAEQNLGHLAAVADRMCVMKEGEIIAELAGEETRHAEQFWALF